MNKIFQEILIVMLGILALIIAWKLFMFLFWIILWAIIIVIGYRGIKYLYNRITQ